LRTAQILVQNTHEAEDLTQETLIKAFRAIDRLQQGTDAKRWLMTILRRTRIDRLRAMAATAHDISLEQMPFEMVECSANESSELKSVLQNPKDVLERFADQDIIHALQQLPEEIRWTLLLVDVEGMDQQEAAEMLDVPVGTIKSRAHRGRSMLRVALLPVARERRLVE
jgi:RNA polymerase sigma-70 factor (ECF subfamily)